MENALARLRQFLFVMLCILVGKSPVFFLPNFAVPWQRSQMSCLGLLISKTFPERWSFSPRSLHLSSIYITCIEIDTGGMTTVSPRQLLTNLVRKPKNSNFNTKTTLPWGDNGFSSQNFRDDKGKSILALKMLSLFRA